MVRKSKEELQNYLLLVGFSRDLVSSIENWPNGFKSTLCMAHTRKSKMNSRLDYFYGRQYVEITKISDDVFEVKLEER